ncbi:hypothetical protein ACJMK2_039132 [Sinanodonta woodiana]|uniref:Mannan endo-1,4-beta-mannosidase n=1 Tax=Sinanodonta woodiana TaxID=1069815 RepID=A0ABD3WD06_SINWO
MVGCYGRVNSVVFLLFLCFCDRIAAQRFLSVSGQNLTLNGDKVFMSGMNQAWYIYANDFGNGRYNASRPEFLKAMDEIHESGGNSVRVWVHVQGENTPMFNSSGYVTGLDPYIIGDMTDYVRQAQSRNILVNFCLWSCAILQTGSHLEGLLYEDEKLFSYINNALKPMVGALKNERGLGIWEIMNEPAGCIEIGMKTEEKCYDTTTLYPWEGADWTKKHIPLERMLRFLSLQADAIHSADPKALVTTGSWTYRTITDQLNRRNFYSDECLRLASGGLPGAYFDLYQIHTYQTLFIYLPHDPFKVSASVYNVSKPLIIGEFSQNQGGGMTSPEQFTWAYEHGYSGAWSWDALGSGQAADDVPTQERGMGSIKDRNDQSKGGRVNITINDGYTNRDPEGFIDIRDIFWIILNFLGAFNVFLTSVVKTLL